jgi:hypothetical protein
MGVGAGVGAGEDELIVVLNCWLRTQASGGVQGTLGETGLPSALQALLAACTMARRRLFSPVCKEAVPWGVLLARGATGEQALEGKPLISRGDPSMMVVGICPTLELAGRLKVAEIVFELATSMVIAPGGRIEAPTTSARARFRVP